MSLLIVFLILINPVAVDATYQQETGIGFGDYQMSDRDNDDRSKLLKKMLMPPMGAYPKDKPKKGISVGQCSIDVEVGGGQKPNYFFRCEQEFGQ